MVITLTGANRFALSAAAQELKAAFETEQGDMGLERLDGEEATIERISEALTSPPFLSNKKMVVIRQGSANKQFMERAADLLADVPDTTEVLLVEPKLDKRSSYYKYLKKSTDYRDYNELDHHGLARWLTETAKQQGGSISQSEASFLVARVGQNQQLLANELDKLLLYEPKITRGSIQALTEATPQSTIFELLETAFAGNTQQALHLYAEQRALKVEPQQIIAMLVWQLHILALIKTAGQRSLESVASEAKVSPYVVKKSGAIANRLTLVQLKRLIADLLDIDNRSKREAYSVDDALQHYILTLAAS